MANTRLHYNDLRATLSGTHTSAATTLNFSAALTHANGTNVPTLAGGDWFLLSALDASGNLVEIVKVTAYTAAATSATVARAQEGTPATAFTAGQKVVGAATAGSLTGDSGYTTPTMTNSWVAYGAPYAPAGYRKDAHGFVHLRGLIKNGTIAAAAFTLPAGYRPAYKLSIPTFNGQGSGVATMEVNTDGTVVPANGSNSFASLDVPPFFAEA